MTSEQEMALRREPTPKTGGRIALALLVFLTLVTLFLQTRSLSIFPIANATRWFSDESWVMEEAKAQIEHGVVYYPQARASTLAHSKGLLLGTPWLSAALYGIPATFVSPGTDLVIVGRVVSLMLTVLTLILLFRFLRELHTPAYLGAFAAMLIASTRASFIASHCARPDVLAGLIVLIVVAYLAVLRDRGFVPSSRVWWFGFGAILMGLAWTSSVHLLTLLGPLTLWVMFSFGAFRRFGFFIAAVAGAVCSALILFGIYTITSSGITVFGSSSQGLQFIKVVQETPILRPFSRSVQVANLLIRAKLFWREAPGFLLFGFIVTLLYAAVKLRNRNASVFSWAERFVLASTVVVLLSWLYLQAAGVTYTMHILPLLTFTLTLVLSASLRQFGRVSTIIPALTLICGGVLFGFALVDSNTALVSGSSLTKNNSSAMTDIRAIIHTDAIQHGLTKPLVIAETPALHDLLADTTLTVMTDHFTAFQTSTTPFSQIMQQEGAKYAVLFTSDHYPKNRYTMDEFFQAVNATGTIIGRRSGVLFDMGSSYFEPSKQAIDTLIVFRLYH
jgi:hypothetical protein